MRLLVVLLIIFVASPSYAKIGDVIQQQGETNVQRKDGPTFEKIEKDFDVESYDSITTKNGKTAIEFLDETRVDVTENSKLIIDEFVYDPDTSTGTLALKASFGTVRYASGQIAKNSRQNITIRTPTAVVGVRGTDFSLTVDETGTSTIILLPSCTIVLGQRLCVVGEIEVSSDIGTVILNKAFQATVVETQKSQPLKPVLLDLSEDYINNLLIIRKPKEITAAIIKIKSPIKVFQIQRQINKYEFEPLQAIIPGIALSKLWQIVSVTENIMLLISAMVIISSFIGMTAILYSTLNGRRKEMALLRIVGASPYTIFTLMITEALIIAISSIFISIFLIQVLALIFFPILDQNFGLYLENKFLSVKDLLFLLSVLFLSVIVSIFSLIINRG